MKCEEKEGSRQWNVVCVVCCVKIKIIIKHSRKNVVHIKSKLQLFIGKQTSDHNKVFPAYEFESVKIPNERMKDIRKKNSSLKSRSHVNGYDTSRQHYIETIRFCTKCFMLMFIWAKNILPNLEHCEFCILALHRSTLQSTQSSSHLMNKTSQRNSIWKKKQFFCSWILLSPKENLELVWRVYVRNLRKTQIERIIFYD